MKKHVRYFFHFRFFCLRFSYLPHHIILNFDTQIYLVSLTAVFWMSHNAPQKELGERCVTSKKTAARETKIYLEGLINRPGCSNVDLVDKSLSSG